MESSITTTNGTITSTTKLATEPAGTTQEPSETTSATVTDESPSADKKCSGFDAWSFVGGMILVGGIVLITFIGVKYYKSKTEQRYHQF